MVASKKKILIFKKQGILYSGMRDSLARYYGQSEVWNKLGFDVELEYVTQDDLKCTTRLNPATVHAFILPGGGFAEYDKSPGAHGFDLIRRYVAEGGNFLGICAGAYFAARRFEWTPPGAAVCSIKTPGLDLFNGVARGPMDLGMPYCGLEQINRFEARLVNIFFTTMDGHKSFTGSLYWGGPTFKPYRSLGGHEIIARMSYGKEKVPVIIEQSFGKGRITLSSIHPEISASQFANYAEIPEPDDGRANCREESPTGYLNHVYRGLLAYDPGREMLWQTMLSRLDRPANSSIAWVPRPRALAS